VIDLPHHRPEVRDRFSRRPFPVDALVWLGAGQEVPDPVQADYQESFRLSVDTHLGWRPPVTEPADPTSIVKQVSFLAAAEGYGQDRFRAHYRHHVEVAGRHMPALWQYVQNDVVASTASAEAAKAIVAVSELWFAEDDFLHHYFPSPEDQAEFSSHEDFLDLTKALSFVATSHQARGAS